VEGDKTIIPSIDKAGQVWKEWQAVKETQWTQYNFNC
jgi:hypothetical protein